MTVVSENHSPPECKNQARLDAITIRPFRTGDEAAFDRLNRAWLTQYFRVEPIDEAIFADPTSYILDKGGKIFIAELEGVIVGVGALIRHPDEHGAPLYELSKMGVDESIRGLGIGRRIMEEAIESAKGEGCRRLIIYSNRKLAPAIGLYRKMGFVEIPLSQEACERYERCDIMLELVL